MPIYEYSCPTCGFRFEKLQSMSATGADCPHCEQPAKRAISVFAAMSKGDGFASDMADLGGSPMPAPVGHSHGGFCGCGHWTRSAIGYRGRGGVSNPPLRR